MNRQQVWKIVGVILLVCGLQLYGQKTASGAEGRFTIIDDPAAGTGPSQGTFPTAINSAGAITGYYLDKNNVNHGFLRTSPHGDDEPVRITGAKLPAGAPITNFDAPGAGTVPNSYPLQGTFPTGINPAGAIAGYYVDANGVNHGFLRAPNGKFANPNIDPTGSTSTPLPASTRREQSSDTTLTLTTLLTASCGLPVAPSSTSIPRAHTTFDGSPGAQYTIPNSINGAGVITGYYFQQLDGYHPPLGFLRKSNGAFIPFDPKCVLGCSFPTASVGPSGINDAGTITGTYSLNGQYHGFVRAPNGKFPFTPFDPPGSTGAFNPPYAINSAGAITGYYGDANSVNHGFLWTPPDE
jgi:hypothetical protein